MINDLFCPILSIFGERLHDIIFDRNMTVPEVAKSIGVPKSTIYRYSSGKFLPSLYHAIALAQHFNCTLDYLFGIEEENHSVTFTQQSSFPERLKELMASRKISVLGLANNTKIDSRNIYYWLKGRVPAVEQVYILSRYFGCSMDYIIGRTS